MPHSEILKHVKEGAIAYEGQLSNSLGLHLTLDNSRFFNSIFGDLGNWLQSSVVDSSVNVDVDPCQSA